MADTLNMKQDELDLGLPPVDAFTQDRREMPSLHDELESLAKTGMVRVAPGRHAWVPAEACDPSAIPQYCICRWAKQADGTYHPIPFPYRLVRLTPETTSMLGFMSGNRDIRYSTLLRLANAEFVEIVRISPNCQMLDLDSWFRHLSECMEDPEFWDVGGEARERYNQANGLGVEH